MATKEQVEAALRLLGQAHAEQVAALALEALQSGLPSREPSPPLPEVWQLPCPCCGAPLTVVAELQPANGNASLARYGDRYTASPCSCGRNVWEASAATQAAFFAELERRGEEAGR